MLGNDSDATNAWACTEWVVVPPFAMWQASNPNSASGVAILLSTELEYFRHIYFLGSSTEATVGGSTHPVEWGSTASIESKSSADSSRCVQMRTRMPMRCAIKTINVVLININRLSTTNHVSANQSFALGEWVFLSGCNECILTEVQKARSKYHYWKYGTYRKNENDPLVRGRIWSMWVWAWSESLWRERLFPNSDHENIFDFVTSFRCAFSVPWYAFSVQRWAFSVQR